MPTQTTNYSFNKPLVNNATDADLWGAQLNSNWDEVDSILFATTGDGDRGDITVSASGTVWTVDPLAISSGKLATAVQDAILDKSQPVYIEKPKDQDYTLLLNLRKGMTITSITTKAISGTCTATFKIGATALGGTANAVSSTEVTEAHTSANVAVAGDDVVLTISANAACLGLSINIFYEEVF